MLKSSYIYILLGPLC